MTDNIDRDWNEMCNNLKDVIQIQVNFVHSISEKLQSLEIGTGSGGGVGEWIEPGTQYTYQGTTYTVGTNVERFNLYGETGDGNAINQAAGSYSHVEGYNNKALGDNSHAEGSGSVAIGNASHAEGRSIALGAYAHAEGLNFDDNCGAIGAYSHVEGYHQQATGDYSHAEGSSNQVRGQYGHVEGWQNNITGNGSHAEGGNNVGLSVYVHLEGENNVLYQYAHRSHIEGEGNHISGDASNDTWEAHVEGRSNKIYSGSSRSHGEGYNNMIAMSPNAHVEGYGNTLTGSPQGHIEGIDNTVSNSSNAHCEGDHCSIVNASQAHVQNYYTQATARSASATGDHTTASGEGSFTMGYGTNASGKYQLVLGAYNKSDSTRINRHDPVNNVDYDITKFPLIIGNGHDDFYGAEYRSDAFKIDCDGKIYVGDNDGVDVSGLNVTSSDNNKVLTASYQNGVGTYSWQDAPESSACIVHTYTDTSLPTKVVLDNNNEYRYINLTNATSLTISIETIDTTKSFYSTIVLHNVSSTASLSTFVTVSGDSVISNIIFLNENNVDLSTADTAELLFFTNGMSNVVMCIAYAYGTASPTPPTPSYDESKIFVIELDENHDDTTNITEHTTLASAKTQLDTNYSTDPSKMYKLFIGDDAFDPPIGIESSTSTFENCLNLYNADIGESINYFYDGAFQGCHNLTIMSVPYALTHMAGYNIQGTNLPSLTIHSNYITGESMVDYIFYDNNLTDLTIDATGTVYLAIDDQHIDEQYSDVFGSASYLGDTSGTPTKPITITFGENVTGIVANTTGYIFGYNNQYGVTVNIPNSVTSISSSFLLGISDLVGNITVNIDNTNGAIPGAPWGAGSASNLTIKYLR